MLQVFKYNQSNVSFKVEDGVTYVNATEMARPFGKLTAHYTENANTKAYVGALLRHKPNIGNPIMVVRGGNTPGTWMQEDIALHFAQWLSPDFYVWCNDRIKELLTTGKTQLPTLDELTMARNYVKALEDKAALQEQLALVAPKAEYADRILTTKNAFAISHIASELGMSAIKLNRLLRDKKVQHYVDGTWIVNSKYLNKGYVELNTVPYMKDGVEKTAHHTVWTEKGRAFIHSLLKPAA